VFFALASYSHPLRNPSNSHHISCRFPSNNITITSLLDTSRTLLLCRPSKYSRQSISNIFAPYYVSSTNPPFFPATSPCRRLLFPELPRSNRALIPTMRTSCTAVVRIKPLVGKLLSILYSRAPNRRSLVTNASAVVIPSFKLTSPSQPRLQPTQARTFLLWLTATSLTRRWTSSLFLLRHFPSKPPNSGSIKIHEFAFAHGSTVNSLANFLTAMLTTLQSMPSLPRRVSVPIPLSL